MADYLIRVAYPSDLDEVYAIFSRADTLHREAHPEIFQKADDPTDVQDFLMTAIQSEDAAVFVADLNGTMIGAIIAWVHQTLDIPLLMPLRYVSVDNLMVAEGFQHQGVGKALMDRIHEWALSREVKSIYLTVWEFNQGALAFYEKLGYEMLHHQMRKELF